MIEKNYKVLFFLESAIVLYVLIGYFFKNQAESLIDLTVRLLIYLCYGSLLFWLFCVIFLTIFFVLWLIGLKIGVEKNNE